MSRKDYRRIANAIHSALNRAHSAGEINGVEIVKDEISKALGAENERFDPDRFSEACGFPPATKDLHYDYRLQAWVADGKIERCGHPEKVRGCAGCHHAGRSADQVRSEQALPPYSADENR